LGLAAVAGTFAIAEGPGSFTTYAGVSGPAALLMVSAGLSLIVAGLITSSNDRSGRTGDLAVLAGLVWFAPMLVGWEGGPPLIRSMAVLVAGFTFPIVFHLAVAWPSGRLRFPANRVMVSALYIESALAAVSLALIKDPFFDPRCWANCTVNSFLVRSAPSAARVIEVTDRWFTVAAALALVAICIWRIVTDTEPARRVLVPVAVPAAVFAIATAAHAIALQVMLIEDPVDPVFFWIFVVGCVSLVLLGAGLAWVVYRIRLHRKAVARIVTELGQVPTPGSLESALGTALGDPELRVAYWLAESHQYVNATGQRVPEPDADPGRTVTTLVRGDQRFAVVTHAAALSELNREIGAAVRLALVNEGLQAELLAQVAELQVSRARIIETGDAERRRLEMDLHDGAQQGLLSLSYQVRGALADAEAGSDAEAGRLLEEAVFEAHEALNELRELAHGIYPAILSEAGLASAVATYADEAPIPVDVRVSTNGRFPESVEMTAYLLVVGAVEHAASRSANHAVVSAVQEDVRLVLTVEDDGGSPISPPVALVDRIGAIGGSLKIGETKLIAELPCE
jgi:signal transduction histidine kinase